MQDKTKTKCDKIRYNKLRQNTYMATQSMTTSDKDDKTIQYEANYDKTWQYHAIYDELSLIARQARTRLHRTRQDKTRQHKTI